jgi:imidazolonepropionase-like amidohydrolase
VITAATATAAGLMGLQDEVGTLQPGRRADVLAVEDNPAERIEALARPLAVLLGGEVTARSGSVEWNPLSGRA